MLSRKGMSGSAPLFALVLFLFSCAGPKVVVKPPEEREVVPPEPVIQPLKEIPVVRVLLVGPSRRVGVSLSGSFYLGKGLRDESLTRYDKGGKFVVSASGSQLRFALGRKVMLKGNEVVVIPYGDNRVYINGKPYRGSFKFIYGDDGVITINIIEIDDYLKGVLPSEVGYLAQNQYEAYRAQAIASRSYALSKLEEKKNEMYDLQATILDQVYKGVPGEHELASRAVDETRGLVAVWDGEPIKAYYSSCCGGHTADIRTTWPWKTPYPYLYGVRDTVRANGSRSLCSRSSHFRWKVVWSGERLYQVLRKTLPSELRISRGSVGRVKDVRITGVGLDGRVKEVEIVTDKGSYRVVGDRIRWVLKPDPDSDRILNSTMFKLDIKKTRGHILRMTAVGGGNGHGVGLCQTGAIRMAELGFSGEEIVQHYYPGVRVVRLYY